MQEKPIDLYQQTEDYFFRAISQSVLDFEKFATCYFTGVEVDNLNLLILRELNLDLNNLLKKATTFFKDHNSHWTALVPSEKMTPQFQKIFEQNNMHFMEESVTMFMPLHEQRAFTKLDDVEIVKTDNALQDWGLPLLSAFESTPNITAQYQEVHQTALKNGAHFQHYTLYKTGKPISSLTLSHVEANCRLDDIGTESDYQNQGYATFLINHVISEAKKAGAQFCFLEASTAGFSVYQKIGFYPLWINQVFGFPSER
jgi:GNAT superfamily N-acetyltransferase